MLKFNKHNKINYYWHLSLSFPSIRMLFEKSLSSGFFFFLFLLSDSGWNVMLLFVVGRVMNFSVRSNDNSSITKIHIYISLSFLHFGHEECRLSRISWIFTFIKLRICTIFVFYFFLISRNEKKNKILTREDTYVDNLSSDIFSLVVKMWSVIVFCVFSLSLSLSGNCFKWASPMTSLLKMINFYCYARFCLLTDKLLIH